MKCCLKKCGKCGVVNVLVCIDVGVSNADFYLPCVRTRFGEFEAVEFCKVGRFFTHGKTVCSFFGDAGNGFVGNINIEPESGCFNCEFVVCSDT